jgi:hypothetical protein
MTINSVSVHRIRSCSENARSQPCIGHHPSGHKDARVHHGVAEMLAGRVGHRMKLVKGVGTAHPSAR